MDVSAVPRSLEQLINEAAGRITRLSPEDAFAASVASDAIIDIRAQEARENRGVIPGSLHIPRTVLEWRVASDSQWRRPHVGDRDQRLILICDHGYSSIPVAANLVELGFQRATDVIGGFEAWEAAGLPVSPSRTGPLAGALAGMDRPEPRCSD